MSAPLSLLQVIGKAALPIVTGGASTVIEVGASIASQVWEWWGKKSKEEERRKELEALAQLTSSELRGVVHDLVGAVAADRSPADRSRLEGYLLAVPAQIRRTLRRPSDIDGRTVPADLVLSRMEDLIPLLPPRPPQFAPGDRVAGTDFELVELLGIGGFGEVWKARNAFMPGAPAVALKFCLDSTAAASLRRETELLDRIQHQGTHPGIVQLRHTFLRAEPPFLEYELVEGGDLGGLIIEWHRKKGGPSPVEAAKLIRRLAKIVAFAHEHGIIHRDLKPANVLLASTSRGSELSGSLKIADFGIGEITAEAASRAARVTGLASTRTAAAACGGYSLYYASPEQVRGAKADPRDDVHAIGVIWYQLLVGDLTAEAPRGPGWKKRLAAKGMSVELIELLEVCTATDRDDRPASAVIVGEQIGFTRSEIQPPPAPPPTPLLPPIGPTDSRTPSEIAESREELVKLYHLVDLATKGPLFKSPLALVWLILFPVLMMILVGILLKVPTFGCLAFPGVLLYGVIALVIIRVKSIVISIVASITLFPVTLIAGAFTFVLLPKWNEIVLIVIAILVIIFFFGHPILLRWWEEIQLTRLTVEADEAISRLRSNFPTETTGLRNIDLHDPAAVRATLKRVERRLAEHQPG